MRRHIGVSIRVQRFRVESQDIVAITRCTVAVVAEIGYTEEGRVEMCSVAVRPLENVVQRSYATD
jgi:hypothetical protein